MRARQDGAAADREDERFWRAGWMWVEGGASVISRNAPPSLLIDGPEGPTVRTYGLPVWRPTEFLKLAPSLLLGVFLWDIRRREGAFIHRDEGSKCLCDGLLQRD